MTHWIGPYVILTDRMVQRCMVCGVKLVDSEEGDTSNLPIGLWYNDETKEVFVPLKVPKDNCLRLIE